MTVEKEVYRAVQGLLSRAHLAEATTCITPLDEGGNNRTYLITGPDGRLVAKHYFRAAPDKRDRLQAEFSFLQYAAEVAPGWTPAALASDPAEGWALYEHVSGMRFQPGDVGPEDLAQAATFFRDLNHPSKLTFARDLPTASEGGFSLAEHVAHTDRRVRRLAAVGAAVRTSTRLRQATSRLETTWARVRHDIRSQARESAIDIANILPLNQRCISPSDFGFHNALRRPDGRITFLDFEYAGWDDPAKMAADVFCQVAIPVPGELFEAFLEQALSDLPGQEDARRRARLLRPVMRARWVCITLNVFLPEHLARRQFADPSAGAAQLHEQQLEKAERLLTQLERSCHDLH